MAKILYQGHGSLRLTTDEGTVVYVDPFAGEGYEEPADVILVSHEHHDHNATELVTKKPGCIILRASDLLKDGKYGDRALLDLYIRAVEAYNDHHRKDECVGFIVETDGKRVYFAGDTSKTDSMAKMKDDFIDYAFLPTDGIYNMGPEEASECAGIICAEHSVPIHMAPGALFDRALAEKFTGLNRLIVSPGEEILL